MIILIYYYFTFNSIDTQLEHFRINSDQRGRISLANMSIIESKRASQK
jgi:hypothetical protein